MAHFIRQATLLFGIFVLLYLGLFWLLCMVQVGGTPLIYRTSETLNWKGGNSWRKFQEYDPAVRHDVVFIGSSHAYRGYDPGIFRQRGYNAFNLGTSAQSPMNSWYILKHHITRENTGLVLLDTYEAAVELDGLESTADLTQNIASDRAAIGMALALRDPRGINMLALRFMRRSAPPMYVDEDYLPGGSTMRPDSVQGRIHYVQGKPLEVHPMQERYLRRFFAHCHREGIPVVLVSHPYPAQANRARHEVFNEWLRAEAAPYGFPYFDFAFDHGLPIHDRHHFYDHNHLNRAGVELFNPLLIDVLEREGLLATGSDASR